MFHHVVPNFVREAVHQLCAETPKLTSDTLKDSVIRQIRVSACFLDKNRHHVLFAKDK